MVHPCPWSMHQGQHKNAHRDAPVLGMNRQSERDSAPLKMNSQFVYKPSLLDKGKAQVSACLLCLASLLSHKPTQEDACCSQHPHAGDGPPHTTQAEWLLGNLSPERLICSLDCIEGSSWLILTH